MKLLIALIASAWAITAGANAAVLVINSDGVLIGADDVIINGIPFDVRFSQESCINAFDGCDDASDFAFDNLQDARDAAQALLDQVFLDTSEGAFDSELSNILGCQGSLRECATYVPYATDGSNVQTAQMINSIFESSDNVLVFPRTLSVASVLNDGSGNFLIFTRTDPIAEVPAPAALWLMLTGLAGVAGLRFGNTKPGLDFS